jgi:hypothetical protein
MYQGVEAYPRWGPASVLIHSLWADARRLFQCAGNPRMARCLSFAARRGGRPRRGVGGGIIEGRTISGVRGGVNASALCLHRGRSHGRGFREGFETADLSLPMVRRLTAGASRIRSLGPTSPRAAAENLDAQRGGRLSHRHDALQLAPLMKPL